MPRKRESNLELLLKLPWWVSATLGVLVFVVMRWVIPARIDQNPSLHPFAVALPKLAILPLLFFGLIAVGSFFFAKKRHRLVDEQTSLEKLRETSWKDFEFLVAEAYTGLGFKVEYSLGRGADGGVDLTLRKDGRRSLVQCKQWKVFSVGAPVVREMFDLMTAEKANEAIIVTTGKFTRDAQSFAEGKPIRLVDGPQLLPLVQSVQNHPVGASHEPAQAREGQTPACPTCGKPMVFRTSRRGANAGNQFWGCPDYPDCKGTRKL
jgi:restriction system protein